MKKLLSILLIIMAFATAPICEAANKEAKIRFTEYKYDFGNIPENGGEVTHDFQFTNNGTGNLIIVDATASCGCTKPKYPEKPIAPGKNGVIKVTYNPKHRPGAFDKTVTVHTNGSPKKVRIRIVGNVIPDNK